jgi:hypothetical protein
MIPKKTLYYYMLLMILCVPIWVNNSTVEGFDFDKAYLVATIISIVIFISNLRSYKNYKNFSI